MIVILIHTISCQSKVAKPHLSGKWTIIEASRDGIPTSTLEDGFLDFKSDSTYETNLFGDVLEYDYQLSKEGFTQSSPQELDFKVTHISKDTLRLTTVIMNRDFVFMVVADTITNTSETLNL